MFCSSWSCTCMSIRAQPSSTSKTQRKVKNETLAGHARLGACMNLVIAGGEHNIYASDQCGNICLWTALHEAGIHVASLLLESRLSPRQALIEPLIDPWSCAASKPGSRCWQRCTGSLAYAPQPRACAVQIVLHGPLHIPRGQDSVWQTWPASILHICPA